MGHSGTRTFRHQNLGVKIYSDVVKALVLQRFIILSHVTLVLDQLLDPVTERSNKVLPQQSEVCVKVDMGACVALRSEVCSEEGLLFLVELLRSWVDGYSPEIFLLFFI